MQTESMEDVSPRFRAQLAGAFYALTIVTAAIAVLVDCRLVVLSDAAATAANIVAHQPLFRLGFLSDIVSGASYLAAAVLLYSLFRDVNRTVSLLAALMSVAACVSGALSCVLRIAPLVVLKSAQSLSLIDLRELQSLALVLLKWRGEAYGISLVFFAIYCLLTGYLIVQSTLLPHHAQQR
jgi:hypothetical protein